MGRKLLGATGFCKPTAGARRAARLATGVLFASWWAWAGLVTAGCGGGAPPPRKPDPFGARVADCIDAPRPASDAAQAQMVSIPAGPALVGSTPAERARAAADYGPGAQALFAGEPAQERIRLHAFHIDKTPVTQETYAEFVQACGTIPPDAQALPPARWGQLQRRFGSRFDYSHVQRFLWSNQGPPPGREQHPMVLVTREQAAFYCAWRGARLPTAEEWERAARGPMGTIYPWGNRFDPARVNSAVGGPGDTLPVGSLPAGDSPEGVSDMGGHVQEWTSTPVAGKPGFFVVKGNGWDGRAGAGRAASRVARDGEIMDLNLGFRCAAD